MTYDNRLIIKQHFTLDNFPKVNSIKLIEYVDFVQVYINNGSEKYASIRLDRAAIGQIKEYLEKLK